MHTVQKWCVSIKWQIINCELSMLSNCVESNLFIHLRFKVTYTKSQKQWLGICDVCNTKSGKANKVNIWINSIFVEKIFYRRSLMTWNAYFCHFIIFVCMLFLIVFSHQKLTSSNMQFLEVEFNQLSYAIILAKRNCIDFKEIKNERIEYI